MRPLLLAVAVAVLPTAQACAPRIAHAPAPAAFLFPARLQAVGTEPFWSIEINGSKIAYSSLEEPEARRVRVKRQEAGGELRLTGTLAGAPITVLVVPETCSDGMSDEVYSYSTSVRFGLQSLQGCARQRS